MMFSKKTSTPMSRQQQRLFEKQLRTFKSTFSCFSTYQLQEIEKIIKSMIIERMKRK